MLRHETERIGGAIDGMYQMSIVALFGIMVCYLAASGGRPLVDGYLIGVDRSFGYDWLSYARFCAAHHSQSKIVKTEW